MLVVDRKVQAYGRRVERVGPVLTFLDCWFGYNEDGVGTTEWYAGPPCWWGLPDERHCMEVARTEEGYFVGVSGCPKRIWSPHGRYSDPFVPLPVLNLRARTEDASPTY